MANPRFYETVLDIYYTLADTESYLGCNVKSLSDDLSRNERMFKTYFDGFNKDRYLRVVVRGGKKIDVKNILNCSLKKPLYAGDNLSNVQLNRFSVRCAKSKVPYKNTISFFDFESYDFLKENYYKNINISGFSEIEFDKPRDIYFRWTEGPVLKIEYEAKSPAPSLVKFRLLHLYDKNFIKVKINGVVVSEITDRFNESELTYLEKAGANSIEFISDRYNKKSREDTFAENDPRELGLYFEELSLNRNISSEP